MLFLGTGDAQRLLVISEADGNAFDALPHKSTHSVTVVDQASGRKWSVRRAACGLGCYCAAEGHPLAEL